MAEINSKKKVLLLEPNYSNKFPPVGLMKLSTYHKRLGFDVVFYKGDLRQFVVERIADKCIATFAEYDSTIDWALRKDIIVEYIRYRKKNILPKLKLSDSEYEKILSDKINEYKDYYWKRLWEKEQEREWDRIMVTTLFTFHWNITIETINFAKRLIKKDGLLMVGGVLATIQPKEIEKATGIKPHTGILSVKRLPEDMQSELANGEETIIDNLPLDYSILDEIARKYSMNNAYYGYTTRGCVRKCKFCAVPIIEPKYNAYIPLKERVDLVKQQYGDQKDLLLMDNNILASERLADIIQDIVDSGFGKNDKFIQPNLLGLAIDNLRNGNNDRAYIRKAQGLIMEFYKKLKMGSDEAVKVYEIIYDKYFIDNILNTSKDNLLNAYEEIKDIYKKHFRPVPRQRCVDFNQGVDARLFTEENVQLLSKINVRPLRIAFDNIKTQPAYDKAIRMSAKVGIRDFSNYLLYNFDDKPEDLYSRLKFNVELCNELDINIYSFPMKYHPIIGGYSHNRDYIGEHWNRKYIRAVQAILNSTKGKIGKDSNANNSFFKRAFGETEKDYLDLLEMPETFILYRLFFEWLGEKKSHPASTANWKACWDDCMLNLSDNERIETLNVIHKNKFSTEIQNQFANPKITQLLEFYTNYRKDIITEGTELFKLKQEYDKNPTIALKRKKN